LGDFAVKYIKQFGLQRSGTNAVKALIELNFKDVCVLTNFLGDKHAEGSWGLMRASVLTQNPSDYGLSSDQVEDIRGLLDKGALPLVFNMKDPVSWVNSYYNYQRKKVLFKNPGAEFVFDVAFAKKVLARYESVVGSWLELIRQSELSFVFIHEEVVAGVSNEKLGLLRERVGLEPADMYPAGRLSGYAKRGIDSQHGRDLINEKIRFDRGYHLEGGWRKDVPGNVMDFLIEREASIFDRLEPLVSFLERK
jgi:hypothetical protein